MSDSLHFISSIWILISQMVSCYLGEKICAWGLVVDCLWKDLLAIWLVSVDVGRLIFLVGEWEL